MGKERVYNFSAGPSMLPLEVLTRAGSEITNYQGSGMSVMEMSHRSKVFDKIFQDTQANFRRLFHVPEEYSVLFLQGGASTQFSMVPLNLIGRTGKADYAVTGNFSSIAYKEAKKYGQINLAASSEDRNHQLLHRVGVCSGGVEHHDARLGAAVHRDVVGPRARPGDGPEVWGEYIVVQLGRAHQNGILVGHIVPHGVALLGQPIQPLGGNLIHRLDLKHSQSHLIVTELIISNRKVQLFWSKALIKSANFSTPSVGMAL